MKDNTSFTSNKMILVVEDNPDDEILTLRALKQGSIDTRLSWCATGWRPWIFCSAPGL